MADHLGYLAELTGGRVSTVKKSVGSHFMLELGDLAVDNDGQQAYTRGEFTLLVECPWRLALPDGHRFGWNDDRPEVWHRVLAALHELQGATVRMIEASEPDNCRLRFSNGTSLWLYTDL